MITLAQAPVGGNSGSGTTLTVTPGGAITNGNGVVVCIGTSKTISSVKDNNNVSLTLARTNNFFSADYSHIYYLSAASGSPTSITVTISATGVIRATVYEVIGTITAHAGNSSNANTSSPAAGAFTTTTPDTITFGAVFNTSISSPPPGYALDFNNAGVGAAHIVYTTTQSAINPTWSCSAGGESCCIEAFTSTVTTSASESLYKKPYRPRNKPSRSQFFRRSFAAFFGGPESTVSTSQGFGLGASPSAEPWTRQGIGLGSSAAQEPFVTQGFGLGVSALLIDLFGLGRAGMLFGSTPDSDKAAAAGVGLGAQFVLDGQYANAETGLALGAKITSDSGDLANGRYRR